MSTETGGAGWKVAGGAGVGAVLLARLCGAAEHGAAPAARLMNEAAHVAPAADDLGRAALRTGEIGGALVDDEARLVDDLRLAAPDEAASGEDRAAGLAREVLQEAAQQGAQALDEARRDDRDR